MNYESREEKGNLCRIYLEDLETTPATELALWISCPRLAGCSSHRKRPLGIWHPRALLALVLDYGLDGASRIICYNIYPIHRMRLNIGNTWSLPRCSASCALCTHAHEFPRSERGYNRQTCPSL
jgi:hypothetical protein